MESVSIKINIATTMRKLLFILTCCMAPVLMHAQKDLKQYYYEKSKECGGVEELMKIKGKWSQGENALNHESTLPKTYVSQYLARIDKIQPLFKEALPKVDGFEPVWYRGSFRGSYWKDGPLHYNFNSLYFIYFCNTNTKKIMKGDETGTWAYVFVNHYNWFTDTVGRWDLDNDGKTNFVWLAPPKVGEWKGLPLYKPLTHDKCLAVVVSHDNRDPWHALTQKEYLTGLKNFWEKKKKDQLDGYDQREERMRKNLNAVPASTPTDIAEKIKAQNQKSFKEFLDKKDGYKTSAARFYDEKLQRIYDYLDKADKATLSKTAIIDPKSGYLDFKGQFGDENKNGRKLIINDPTYYRKDMLRYTPQFAILYWRWTDEHPSLAFKKQFEENFPIEKLQAMLDH
jgi:hypothetical protein